MNEAKQQVIGCISMVLKLNQTIVDSLKGDESLRVLGLSSMNFMQLFVMIENEFDIEIDIEELGIDQLDTVDKITQVIEQAVMCNGLKQSI